MNQAWLPRAIWLVMFRPMYCRYSGYRIRRLSLLVESESWALEYGIHLTNGIQNASSIDKKSLIQGRGAYHLHKPTGKKSCAKTRKKNYKIWHGGRTTRYNEYSNQLDSACFLRLHKRNGANHLISHSEFPVFHVNDTYPSLLAIRNPQRGF